MIPNNEKVSPFRSFLVISRIEILVFCVLVGLILVLSFFKLIDFTAAFYVLFAFALSIHLFAFQKRASINALLMFISGLLFLSSGFLSVYRDTLSFPVKGFFYQISGGIFSTAGGLMVIALSIAMVSIIRSNSPSNFKYRRYLMLMWFCFIFLGSIIAGTGIYSVIRGLQYL